GRQTFCIPAFRAQSNFLSLAETMRATVIFLRLTLLPAALLLSGCMNHYLIHPERDPAGVATWSEEVTRGPLKMHLEWAQPSGVGPFPTVIVHPEGGGLASDMKGVTRDLAQHGYLAVGVDYERLLDGKFRRNTFAWREDSDTLAALKVVRGRPQVDRARIAALGFSQGAIYSLLMAAHAPDIKAVVAYYPVTDFRKWFDTERDWGSRLAFRVIEWHFRRESGAASDAEFEEMLRRASPMTYVDSIRAPLLLIHGADDTSAGVEESSRLERALRERGREVELLVVPGAGHVFNFRDPEPARRAWDATLEWLRVHIGQSGDAAKPPVARARRGAQAREAASLRHRAARADRV
ncbi:MAG TPA: dienelactone hydrolase family protein, partial [Burkholderiales bacterium]|nr:dienelactone hydrolase family protein [Burkholderiales bacterium]